MPLLCTTLFYARCPVYLSLISNASSHNHDREHPQSVNNRTKKPTKYHYHHNISPFSPVFFSICFIISTRIIRHHCGRVLSHSIYLCSTWTTISYASPPSFFFLLLYLLLHLPSHLRCELSLFLAPEAFLPFLVTNLHLFPPRVFVYSSSDLFSVSVLDVTTSVSGAAQLPLLSLFGLLFLCPDTQRR